MTTSCSQHLRQHASLRCLNQRYSLFLLLVLFSLRGNDVYVDSQQQPGKNESPPPTTNASIPLPTTTGTSTPAGSPIATSMASASPSASIPPSRSQHPSEHPSISLTPSRTPVPSISHHPSATPTLPPTTTTPSATPTISYAPSIHPTTSLQPTLSLAPSLVPSKSMSPSAIPSLSSQPSESVLPSFSPTVSMQPTRSQAPSMEASSSPTDIPSTLPSVTPTSVPSTATPSTLPSFTPSAAPSPSPTFVPTALPSNGPTRELTLVISKEIRMTIGGLTKLKAPSRQRRWEEVTSDHIMQYWNERQNIDIIMSSVETELLLQTTTPLTKSRPDAPKNATMTRFDYKQTLSYSLKSNLAYNDNDDDDKVMDILTFRPFTTAFVEYQESLEGFVPTNYEVTFEKIESVPYLALTLGGVGPSDTREIGSSTGAIAAGVVGSIAALVLLFLGLYVYQMNREKKKVLQKRENARYNLEGRDHHHDDVIAPPPQQQTSPLSSVHVLVNGRKESTTRSMPKDVTEPAQQEKYDGEPVPLSVTRESLVSIRDGDDNVSELSVNLVSGSFHDYVPATQAEIRPVEDTELPTVSFLPVPANDQDAEIKEEDTGEKILASAFGIQVSEIDDLEDLE